MLLGSDEHTVVRDKCRKVADTDVLPRGRLLHLGKSSSEITPLKFKQNPILSKLTRPMGSLGAVPIFCICVFLFGVAGILGDENPREHAGLSLEAFARQLKDFPSTTLLSTEDEKTEFRQGMKNQPPRLLSEKGATASVSLVTTNKQSEPRRAVVQQVEEIVRKHGKAFADSRALARTIVLASNRNGIDPILVAALIKSESAFDKRAVSHKGAQGLMQLMPKTADWVAKTAGLRRRPLTDAGYNVQVGIEYLKYLEAEHEGNLLFALIAYNWGPGHVRSATSGARRVPRECMKYALTILRDYSEWKRGVV
jgi:prophage antirepressor-like protein